MTAERRPYHLRSGEGASVWSLGGRFVTKVGDGESAGRFALVQTLAFRTSEPPLHVHHREDEAWYLLDGAMTFYVDAQAIEATAGSFVFAPTSIPHTFTVGREPTRVLVFASPAGFERFAAELGERASSDVPSAALAMPGPDVIGLVAERYGIQIVGPPRRVSALG